MSLGQFYYFEVADLQDNFLSIADIQNSLKYIVEHAHQQQHYHKLHAPLGLLTSLDRSSFAKVYQILANHDVVNQQSLNIMNTALFFLCMDDEAPANINDLSRLMLHR